MWLLSANVNWVAKNSRGQDLKDLWALKSRCQASKTNSIESLFRNIICWLRKKFCMLTFNEVFDQFYGKIVSFQCELMKHSVFHGSTEVNWNFGTFSILKFCLKFESHTKRFKFFSDSIITLSIKLLIVDQTMANLITFWISDIGILELGFWRNCS